MSPAPRASSAADRLTASVGWTTAILIGPSGRTSCSRRTRSSPCETEMRTCGSVLRERSMRSVGAVTIASPAITVCPRWLTHVQSSVRRSLALVARVTFTVVVSVSPARIGARKFSVWRSYTVPAPGSRVPSTAEMSAAPHMPCAITPSPVDAASSASRWRGLTSPDSAANSWMSAAVSVRSMLARSPTRISSKVRLRMTSRSEAERVSVMVVSQGVRRGCGGRRRCSGRRR